MLVTNPQTLRRFPQYRRDEAAAIAVRIALTTPAEEIRKEACSAYVALVRAGAAPQPKGDILLHGSNAVANFLGEKDPVESTRMRRFVQEWLGGSHATIVPRHVQMRITIHSPKAEKAPA